MQRRIRRRFRLRFFDKTGAVGVADPDGMRAHASGSGAERVKQQEQAAAENEQIFVLLENWAQVIH